jgi:hypothetical protein
MTGLMVRVDLVPVHGEAVQMEPRSGKPLFGRSVPWRRDMHFITRVQRGLRNREAV